MKLDIVKVEIGDEAGLVATVSMFDNTVVEVELGEMGALYTAESWRELADKVSEAIDLMFPKP